MNKFNRRQLIRAGLGAAGLSLADILRLRAEYAGTATPPDTAVIFVQQEGGASQFETYDPKPNAPAEYRGEFGAICTSVPGVLFSEGMSEQARQMHRVTVLRSIHHPSTQHSSSVHLFKTGYYCRPEANENEMPAVGCYVSRVRGPNDRGMPQNVLIANGMRYDSGHFLGGGHNPMLIQTSEENMDMRFPSPSLLEGISDQQWQDRQRLLADFDQVRRIADTRGAADSMDVFRRQAYQMVTSIHARQAFRLDAEPLALRQRYGMNPIGQRFLLARRLVEHGVSFVSVGTFGWDHHGDLWREMRRNGPMFDRAVATLIEDLWARGLDRRVLVVVMGEFGREPRITSLPNLPPGRDHWGNVMSVLVAGGSAPRGLVVGASDARGGAPVESPYRLECVLAYLYRHLGIDPAMTFPDFTGRPRNLLEIRNPITQME